MTTAKTLYAGKTDEELRALIRRWPREALRKYVGPAAFAELERRLGATT